MRKSLIVVLAATVVASGSLLASVAQAAPARGISITGYAFSPSKGSLTVKVKPWGWKMFPALIGSKPNRLDGGHWALYVNGKVRARSGKASVTVTGLPKGRIRFFVALANNDLSRLERADRSPIYTHVVG